MMQQVQDKLNFKIDTPSDEELAKRFAYKQDFLACESKPQKLIKHKKRVSKNAKKLARTNKQFKRTKYKRSQVTA